MIFENQSDLLLKNFQFQSENLANTILTDIQSIGLSRERDEGFEVFRKTLKLYEISRFSIFDSEGQIIHLEPEVEKNGDPIEESVLKKTKEVSSDKEGNLFKARYSLELNESDFTVNFLLPIRLSDGKEVFLYTHFNISSIQDRLKQLYIQVGYAVIWGVLFHIIFAILVYRAIFKRVGDLEIASKDMATGNLESRVNWKFKSEDELDSLGKSFNQMAEEIQNKVTTITRLNQEINQELQIGKEVQELFLPSVKKFKKFNIRPSTKEVRFIDSSGPPLGMGDDIQYSLDSFPVEPGDKIILYTDGVVETPIKEGGLFGLERFTEIVLENIHLTNAEIVEKAMALLEEKHEEYKDDVTMLVLDVPE